MGLLEQVTTALPAAIKNEAQLIEFEMARFVEAHLDEQGPARGVRSASHQIGAQSGRLSRSFVPKQRDHVSAFVVRGHLYDITFGTSVPYANIHEHGGVIHHPGSSKPQAFNGTDGRLVVTSHTKPHDIRIPARPFMGPALRDFKEKALQRHLSNIMETVMRAANHG